MTPGPSPQRWLAHPLQPAGHQVRRAPVIGRRGLVTDDRSSHDEVVMPKEIQRDELRRLLESGAQLVEVMPAESYEDEHIPGAISLPLERLNRDTAGRLLRKERPVITYCYDAQ
jgi:hypothetical protein